MNETGLEKRLPTSIREKGQYAAAFGVIAAMLYFAGFPLFLLFFVGVLTFFVWKVFSSEGRSETRRIFEFYLSANEILRDDDRRWYGFEIQEAIARGETIVRSMSAAPPLVYFGLGALYQKLDDHASAARHLAQVVEEFAASESAIVYPTKEFREYVRMLRRIERAPAEAPLTSKAIRALERSRKNRARELLEHSRSQLANGVVSLPQNEKKLESVVDVPSFRESDNVHSNDFATTGNGSVKTDAVPGKPPGYGQSIKRKKPKQDTPPADRKTISEVLHDVYGDQ